MTTVNFLLLLMFGSLFIGAQALVVRWGMRRPKPPEGSRYDGERAAWTEFDDAVERYRNWRIGLIWTWISTWALSACLLIAIPTCGPYLAGQGDALIEARTWTERWVPGGEYECQARDTDDNNYVSCTVGAPNGELTAIECGVNRWYQGWQIDDCRLMKGYSGSQGH
jgi:hypothetical protein